jgi:hypothetical protein
LNTPFVTLSPVTLKVEANVEAASKMKSDGMPTELISKYTGLSIEEIEAL